jgi:hypothetical protein
MTLTHGRFIGYDRSLCSVARANERPLADLLEAVHQHHLLQWTRPSDRVAQALYC